MNLHKPEEEVLYVNMKAFDVHRNTTKPIVKLWG